MGRGQRSGILALSDRRPSAGGAPPRSCAEATRFAAQQALDAHAPPPYRARAQLARGRPWGFTCLASRHLSYRTQLHRKLIEFCKRFQRPASTRVAACCTAAAVKPGRSEADRGPVLLVDLPFARPALRRGRHWRARKATRCCTVLFARTCARSSLRSIDEGSGTAPRHPAQRCLCDLSLSPNGNTPC